MKSNIKVKLIGSFSMVLLLMVIVGLVSIYTSKIIRTELGGIVEHDVEATHLIGNISRRVSFIHSNSLLHLITNSIDDKIRYESEIVDSQSKIEEDLDKLKKICRGEACFEKIAEFRAAWKTYLIIWNEQVVPLSRASRNNEAFALTRKRGIAGTANKEVMNKLDELQDTIVFGAAHKKELIEQEFGKNRNFLLTINLLAIIFGLAFAIVQSTIVSNAVNSVSQTAQLVAAGDLDQSVEVSTGDEIESMANSFNTMVRNMKEMVNKLRNEISEREKVERTLQETKQGLELMVQKRTSELSTANEQLREEIAERKQVEEMTRKFQRQSELILNSAVEGIFGLDLEGKHTFVNTSAAKMLGYEVAELIGKHSHEIWHHSKADGSPYPKEECPVYAAYKDGDVYNITNEVFWKEDDTSFPVEYTSTPIRENGKIVGAVVTFRDISERQQALEMVQNQLQRITCLHNIDMAITSSLDLHITLNILLEQVIAQLHVDAASIMLLNRKNLTLEYAAGCGFRSNSLQHTCLRLGEGLAGTVALERCIISIPNLAEEKHRHTNCSLLAGEEFIFYYCLPLIAKGNVRGVLEVFRRTTLRPDQVWMDFMEALSTQAAIAIDNASLFDELQRSNDELAIAYDTTLEGWSKALDLRDKETEGHSRRVKDMTVRISRFIGLSDAEVTHIRRGSLLHDIGKLGIPDKILLKSGPLSDEEWVIMRKHPVLAYELLSSIAFLLPALDIPYCHHEKWDGTGYPCGLKGEQIPLAARIFAVVDVWDALKSERPYRPSWSEEKRIEYLKSQAGKHFDPEMVEVFLKLLKEETL